MGFRKLRSSFVLRSFEKNKAWLNEIFSEELQKKKLEILHKFLPVIKDYESEELAKEKVKAQLKLQDIYKKRQHETIKNIDTEITNYVAKDHSKDLTEKLLKHWEQGCKLTEVRAKDKFEKEVE